MSRYFGIFDTGLGGWFAWGDTPSEVAAKVQKQAKRDKWGNIKEPERFKVRVYGAQGVQAVDWDENGVYNQFNGDKLDVAQVVEVIN